MKALWLGIMMLLYYVSNTLCQCINGEIRATVSAPNYRAGRLFMCNESEWKVICHHGWDLQDARVACRQLGFPPEGAFFCISSCLGESNSNGLTDFGCTGDETKLSSCSHTEISGDRSRNNNNQCKSNEHAGILCYDSGTTPPIMCPQVSTTLPPCPTCLTQPCSPLSTTSTDVCPPCESSTSPVCPPPPTISTNACPPCAYTESFTSSEEQPAMTPSSDNMTTSLTGGSSPDVENVPASSTVCPAGDNTIIGSALGAVIAILLLSLVGVAFGWVWSCHRKKRASKLRDEPDSMDINPCYAQTTPTANKHGSKALPTSHTPQGDEDYVEVI